MILLSYHNGMKASSLTRSLSDKLRLAFSLLGDVQPYLGQPSHGPHGLILKALQLHMGRVMYTAQASPERTLSKLPQEP